MCSPGVHKAVRDRAVLPGLGRAGLQAVFQQRKLRGLKHAVRIKHEALGSVSLPLAAT